MPRLLNRTYKIKRFQKRNNIYSALKILYNSGLLFCLYAIQIHPIIRLQKSNNIGAHHKIPKYNILVSQVRCAKKKPFYPIMVELWKMILSRCLVHCKNTNNELDIWQSVHQFYKLPFTPLGWRVPMVLGKTISFLSWRLDLVFSGNFGIRVAPIKMIWVYCFQ